MRSRQISERLGVEEAHMREFQHFNFVWDRKTGEYESHAHELVEVSSANIILYCFLFYVILFLLSYLIVFYFISFLLFFFFGYFILYSFYHFFGMLFFFIYFILFYFFHLLYFCSHYFV